MTHISDYIQRPQRVYVRAKTNTLFSGTNTPTLRCRSLDSVEMDVSARGMLCHRLGSCLNLFILRRIEIPPVGFHFGMDILQVTETVALKNFRTAFDVKVWDRSSPLTPSLLSTLLR